MSEQVFTGKHAVIIEDDRMSIDVLVSLLSKLEVSYTIASNNEDLEEIFTNHAPIDVIFLDLEMPGRNGYEVLSAMKDMPEAQGIPIVAYTTHLSHVNDASDAGFHSFLGKPLNRHEFPNHLARILNNESVWELP